MTCSAAERARLRPEAFLALLSALAIPVHARVALLLDDTIKTTG